MFGSLSFLSVRKFKFKITKPHTAIATSQVAACCSAPTEGSLIKHTWQWEIQVFKRSIRIFQARLREGKWRCKESYCKLPRSNDLKGYSIYVYYVCIYIHNICICIYIILNCKCIYILCKIKCRTHPTTLSLLH